MIKVDGEFKSIKFDENFKSTDILIDGGAAVVEEGTIVTPDIGGSASTDEFTAAIIRKLG